MDGGTAKIPGYKHQENKITVVHKLSGTDVLQPPPNDQPT